MKNKINFGISTLVLLVLIFLTGCSSSSSDFSNTYNPLTDHQYMYQEQGAAIRIAAVKQGYYFLNGNYMYYADKATMKPVLLDNHPNSDCLKVEESQKPRNCNAYVDKIPSYHGFLAFYNDKLYTVQNKIGISGNEIGTEVLEISKDGSRRKSILTLAFDPQGPQAIAIHRGFLYYDTRDYSKESELDYQIKRFDLNGSSAEPETIYRGDLPMGGIIDITPYGKNIYFFEAFNGGYRTMRYDLKTKQTEKMFHEDDVNSNASILGIQDDRLMVNYFYNDVEDERSWVSHISNLEGADIQKLPIKSNFLSNYYWSGDFIFTRPVIGYPVLEEEKFKHVKDELIVYDSNYQIVENIDTSFLNMSSYIVPGDKDYMFVQYTTKEAIPYIRYLDKKEIGTGQVAFVPFIESP